MSLNNSVQKLSADEPEFAIDCGGGSTSVCPALTSVVGQRRIGVLKIGDCD